MSNAADIFIARLKKEEGERFLPYDDATGVPVTAPTGNLSWGHGYNLMKCGSPGLFSVMDQFLVGAVEEKIAGYAWFAGADDTRKSVFIDIAYNGGVADLLGYPKMLAAATAGDWVTASAECTEKDPKLDASRYAPLRALLYKGDET